MAHALGNNTDIASCTIAAGSCSSMQHCTQLCIRNTFQLILQHEMMPVLHCWTTLKQPLMHQLRRLMPALQWTPFACKHSALFKAVSHMCFVTTTEAHAVHPPCMQRSGAGHRSGHRRRSQLEGKQRILSYFRAAMLMSLSMFSASLAPSGPRLATSRSPELDALVSALRNTPCILTLSVLVLYALQERHRA